MSIRTASFGCSSTVWRMLTIGSRTGPSLLESGRLAIQGRRRRERPMPADEPHAIGFVRRLAHGRAPHGHHVRHPRGLLFGRARTARAIDRLTAWNQFGLHKQIAERRMGFVLRLRRQHHFGIAGDFDRARRLRAVRQRHASQFDVVFGRDADLGVGFDLVVACGETQPGLA